MQAHWRTTIRISIALVATFATALFCSVAADSIVGASDISDQFYVRSSYSFTLSIIVTLIAFFVGGLIAKSQFLIPAIALQLLLQSLEIAFWSAWGGRPFSVELIHHWPISMALTICAVAAALVGMNVSRKISIYFHRVVT